MPVFFPQMHPELLPDAVRRRLPSHVRFLEPGLGVAKAGEHMAPTSAPFDVRTARALLADTLRFGEEQASPRDMMAQSLVEQAGALSAESGRAVQAEVERSLIGGLGGGTQADPLEDARRRAQMLLLLAWSLEERLLELRGVEDRLKSAWGRLDQSVAPGAEVVDEEADEEALSLGRELSGLTPPEASSVAMPWRKLLEGYALLVPGEPLLTSDQSIAAALEEAGLAPLAQDASPEGQCGFREPLWRLMGLASADDARPWLSEELQLDVLVAQAGEGAE